MKKEIWERDLRKRSGKEIWERDLGKNHEKKISFPNPFPQSFSPIPFPILFLLIVGIVGIFFSEACHAIDQTVAVTILHTNDTYGRITPFPPPTGEVGGLARRSYLIHKIVKETKGQALVLDAGSAISPLPPSNFDQGKSIIQIMNRAGYTAMTLGNHEFDYGLEVLQQRISEANFDILSSNVFLKDTGKPIAKTYTIKEINGVKFGIFGLTPPEAKTISRPEETRKLKILPPIQTANEIVRKLKEEEKCDFVIALSHLGYLDDRTLAQQAAGINLIIGGHLSTYDERTIWRAIPIDEKIGPTIVYTPSGGSYLGRVDLTFKPRDKRDKTQDNLSAFEVTDINYRKYRISGDLAPDSAIEANLPGLLGEINRLVEAYQESENVIIGEVKEGEELDMTQFILRVMRQAANSEISMYNLGGLLRPNRIPVRLKGPIKLNRISEIVIHKDVLVTMYLSGRQLKKIMDFSAQQSSEDKTLTFIGIDKDGSGVNGRPLKDSEYYLVATNSFLAEGGDGYSEFRDGHHIKRQNRLVRDAVIQYVQELTARGEVISMSKFTDYTAAEGEVSIDEVSFEEVSFIPTSSSIISAIEPDDIDLFAQIALMDEQELEAYDFYNSKLTNEKKFFIIGMIYADLTAKLNGHFSKDMILEELSTLQSGLDAMWDSDFVYSYLFELENIISSDEYPKSVAVKVLSMLYPFIEDLAESQSKKLLINLRAGHWIVDLGIVAATKNQLFAQQSEVSQSFAEAYEKIGAKKEVTDAFREISRVTSKSPLSNQDFSELLSLLKKLRQELLK